MKEIIVPPNNSVYQTLVILCPIALFFLGRFWFQDFYSVTPRWWFLLVLGILFTIAAYLLIRSLQKIRSGQPALRISRAGVEDNISMAQPGLIKWENIKGAAIVKYTGSDHLLIYLKDPLPVIRGLNFFKTKMAEQMVEDVKTPIAINPKLVRYDIEKLRVLIDKQGKRK